MAAKINNSAPERLVAGDYYAWQTTPAGLENVDSVSVSIKTTQNPGFAILLHGVNQGDSFKFELLGSYTEDLDPGNYVFTESVLYDHGRETGTGTACVVVANPFRDLKQSHTRKVVDLLQAHIEGRLPEGIESTTVGNVPISKIPLSEAVSLLDRYKNKLREEDKKAAQELDPNRASGNIAKGFFTQN
jgi:hypothetical protein